MNSFKKTAIASAVAQIAFMSSGAVMAQSTPDEPKVVVISGQRAALQSAQTIKMNSDEIVDSIVADDIGKLPDRSITEVLQRIVGVTIDRTMSRADPEHYSVEGSGVAIRGLTYVRSELNGRDSFSANGGRSLNFEDVPPELMAGVDVYKNPSAEQVEGAVGGLVNLRTAMPFDYKGFKGAVSAQTTYSALKKGKTSPSGSVLFSNRWTTPIGEIGALVDFAYSESATRTDAVQVEPYYPRNDIVAGKTVWIPKGAQWRTLEFNRKREGNYAAFQWKPSKTLNTSLTYFKSKYRMNWGEQAIFAQSSPYNIEVSKDATYDENNALLTGTLTDTKDGGINFGDAMRDSNRKSSTTDVSFNVVWRPADQWTVKSDFQTIRANTGSFDSTVATGVTMPKEKIDLTGSVPRLIFDDADRANLANPKNYYWAFTMEHKDVAVTEGKAWKTDVQYDFDHKVLRDVRFGVRLTERDAITTNTHPSYNWAAITQPWQVGWNIPHTASLGDPRFGGSTNLHSFDNFFGGGVPVPAVVFPNIELTQNYPAAYEKLHSYHTVLCKEQAAAQGWGDCDAWKPASFGTDPAGVNNQNEKTGAFYTQLRFGFDDMVYPIDGNIGVRYVKTDMRADGYTLFTSKMPTVPPAGVLTGFPIPVIPDFRKAEVFENSYSNVLPSLNLRMKVSDKLQFRFAFASAISRPDFTNLQGYTTFNQDTNTTSVEDPVTKITTIRVNSITRTGEATGNPLLTPIKSNQVDLTAEWYFAPAGSLTLGVFNKQLKDIIVNQTSNYQIPDINGKMQDFIATAPINGARGNARGFEIAYQQYFDKLPGLWSGFGMQANFTFVDSKRTLYNPVFAEYCSSNSGGKANLNLNMNGCDVDGRTFGNLPLQNLSRQSANLALMYDKGPLSSRVAYSWRSKSLQNVNVNGTQGSDGTDTDPKSPTFGGRQVAWGLPVWADDYGQLDASIFYKFSDSLSIGLEGQNLTDSKWKQLMEQKIGMKGRAWFVSGPRYTAQVRYTF